MTLDDGVAFRIPAGSVLGLQIHYTTTGKPEKNRMSVGFKFPRDDRAAGAAPPAGDDVAVRDSARARPLTRCSATARLPATRPASACSRTCTCAART